MPTDLESFTKLFAPLKALYSAPMTEEEFRVKCLAYHQQLGHHSPEIIAKACQRAWKRFPNSLPNCGHLAELCEEAEGVTAYGGVSGRVDAENQSGGSGRYRAGDRLDGRVYGKTSEKSKALAQEIVADVLRKLEGKPPADGKEWAWEKYNPENPKNSA